MDMTDGSPDDLSGSWKVQGPKRLGSSARRWEYSKIGWLKHKIRMWRTCHRCGNQSSDLYKRYTWDEMGGYRAYFEKFDAVYCKPCIEALWEQDDSIDTLDALGD